jgi:outer membrane protein OmpA-like peptidoglycan-associated protein
MWIMNSSRSEEDPCKTRASRPSWKRFARALVAAGCLVGMLSGCQTPGPTLRAERVETLRSLGFAETDEGWTLSLAVPILFDVDSDELKPGTKRAIADMARELRKVGIERIRIEGHTDNLGNRSYNVELSRRRAEVVAREFVECGFPDTAIERKGWGFEHPVASNDTQDGRALNRRVAIVVVAAGPGVN